MKLKWILYLLFPLPLLAQSFNTITIDGVNDFNTTYERFQTTSGTDLYAYLTWDETYFYFGFSGNSPAGTVTDNDRVYHIYFDTDPQQNPTTGNGTTDGETWRFDPTLPFNADYHYAFKTADNSEFRREYNGAAWQDAAFATGNWKGAGYWELRITRADLGNPSQINVAAYVEEDWDGGNICGGLPSNLFTNTASGGAIAFNNHFKNYYLISNIYPNHIYHDDNYQWMINLTAATASLNDNNNYAGMAVNATTDFDSTIDLAEPPPPGSNFLQLYFDRPAWSSVLGPKFSRDIKELEDLSAAVATWEFIVSTDQLNTDVTITGQNFDHIPAGYNIHIYDSVSDLTHDIREDGDFIYNTGVGRVTRTFELRIGVSTEPNITADPDSLAFGTVLVGDSSEKSVKIKNTGNAVLNISNIISTNAVFTFTGGTSHAIAAGDSITIPVTFAPAAAVSYLDSLKLISDDPDTDTLSIPLTGTGDENQPQIAVSDTTINFGQVPLDYESTFTLTIYNNGDDVLNISAFIFGDAQYSISGTTPLAIAANDSAARIITFLPNTVAVSNTTLRIASDDPVTDTLVVNINGEGVQPDLSFDFSAGWSLFSVPVLSDPPTPEAIIEDDVVEYFLFSYDNSSGYFSADTILPGSGFWFGIETDETVDIQGDPQMDDVTLNLNEGWNIVASPFTRRYFKSNVQFSNGGGLVSPDDAVNAGWIQNAYFGYDQSDSSYAASDTLKQWHGYFFAALVPNVEMFFDYDAAEDDPLPDKPEKIDMNYWYLDIIASNQYSKDMNLRLGVAENATDGFDPKYDLTKPPVPPVNGAVQTYFYYNNWNTYFTRYANDIRKAYDPSLESKVWNFSLVSGRDGIVTLSWEDLSGILPPEFLENYELILDGDALGTAVDMLNITEVSFDAEADKVFQFTVQAAVTGIGGDEIINYSYKLSQNYPNPFNPTTTIEYEIAKAVDVKIELIDVLGRTIKTIVNKFQTAGRYQVILNANALTSGVYFYKIEAGDFVSTKKLILLK